MAVIITADDDEDVRQVITLVLQRSGHSVIAVSDGAAALEQARKHRPDLVLLDGLMPPGMSGFEACKQLHEDPATTAIPVLMVSGSLPPGDVLKMLPCAADALAKPFTSDDLRSKVQRILEGKVG